MKNNIIIIFNKIKYFSNVSKSVFDIKDFNQTKENLFTMVPAYDETFNCKWFWYLHIQKINYDRYEQRSD